MSAFLKLGSKFLSYMLQIKGEGAFEFYQAFLDAVTRFFELGTSYLVDQAQTGESWIC